MTNVPLSPTVIRAADLEEARRLADQRPDAIIELFLGDWAHIDRARAQVVRLGLGGRIAVHHRSALAFVRRLGRIPPAPPASTSTPAAILQRFIVALTASCVVRAQSQTNNGVHS